MVHKNIQVLILSTFGCCASDFDGLISIHFFRIKENNYYCNTKRFDVTKPQEAYMD